ncbi:ATP-dependent Clp protease ATP-binding subunit ClpA [Roseimicrobium gellanilyticum]|uniref:ATP-dependent Clp protease ATP-binding subunit ClpA n=1 Tax=Roseimicrobium gellanilyticum TaxID=748857 RepID=A0A366HSS8_9BACT|nr:AAA family ATPase [Roseimicrobium gellanilyticum]RBP45984.1 ATP-dependent Clp protease ATP-binding subunit ClpA [Roseimicrobium gellanilyticum]
MPEVSATLHLVTRTLEDSAEGASQLFIEFLLFPGLSTLAHRERRARFALLDVGEELLKALPLDEISRRVVLGEPEMTTVELSVIPGKRTEAWKEAMDIRLDALVWEQSGQMIAVLPALSISVIAPSRNALPDMLKEHALSAIKRDGWNTSHLQMALLQRGDFKLQSIPWTPSLESARDRWKRLNATEKATDVVEQLCTRMEEPFLAQAYEVQTTLAHLARLLSLPDKPSILLVGPGGVGKTALVQELVLRRGDHKLGEKAFYRSSGSRLIAGACGFGMWQKRCRDLVESAKQRPVIFFLGNLFELMNVGQSSAGSESIASFLRPYLIRRDIQVIVECTPEQMAVIEKNDPRLSEAFRIMKVEEPSREAEQAILLSTSIKMGRDRGRFTREALQRIAALHHRFMGYAAFPGAPLRFMQRLHEGAEKNTLIEEAEVFAAFSSETGMPRHLLDPQQPLDLAATRAWFQRRVQGQDAAVEVITSVIAQLKAGLTRPGRPLASLLFTGPTGTGKTEMAKALAEFLFQSPERMIRLDMSEYGQPWSAQRLVNGSHGGKEGILTAAVREQPFNVLLLDEFEKADAAVFDLLLQVLGEARLTDAAGRTADFSNCVVIMTSNLGAQEYSRGRLGFDVSGSGLQDAVEHFTSAVQKALRPEMFNRIDRIVPYRPLSEEVVLSLTRREVDAVSLRSGFASRKLRLEVSEPLLRHLAAKGYDPRYGARPLKRRIAEELLAPLSDKVMHTHGPYSIQAELGPDGRPAIEVIRPDWSTREVTSEAAHFSRSDLQSRTFDAARLRRAYQRLLISTMTNGLRGKVRLLEQKLRAQRMKDRASRRSKNTWMGHDPELDRLKTCLTQMQNEANTQFAREEALIVALHQDQLEILRAREPLTMTGWEDLVLEAYALWQPPPKRLIFFMRGQPGSELFDFARVYHDVAASLKASVRVGLFYKKTPARLLTEDGLHVLADSPPSVKEQATLWTKDVESVSAIALWIEGAHANMHLKHEDGLHLSKSRRKSKEEEAAAKKADTQTKNRQNPVDWACRLEVRVPGENMQHLGQLTVPLQELVGLPDLESGTICRQYDPVKQIVREGSENARKDGRFQEDWLLQSLRAITLGEALA